MPDKIGLLVAPKLGDWTRYIQWFSGALRHNIPIMKLPNGGADGNSQAIVEAAVKLANDPDVKVIVTAGTGPAKACKAVTLLNGKPFVYASVGDPKLSDLVPGPQQNNFTGGNNRQAVKKVVEQRVDYMLTNAVFLEPFAIVGDYGREPMKTAMDLAYDYLTKIKAKRAQLAPITSQNDIATFVRDLRSQSGINSLYVCSDMFLTVNSTLLNTEAHNLQPPMATMFEFEEHAQAHGADDYYGSDFEVLFKTAANYVDEILDGAAPIDLPIYIAPLKGLSLIHI